jgi:eukaryotic-like serine/threonine-protein kinase
VAHPARQALQHRLERLRGDEKEPEAASWFVTDAAGLQLARAPDSSTIGYNFAWRSYFTGDDHPQTWRAKPDEHITKTNLSYVFLSVAANRWSVAISTPIVREEETASEEESAGRFLGIMAMTVEVGRFIVNRDAEQFAVLVDMRSGPDRGLILEHPLFEQLIREHGQVPDRFLHYRLQDNQLPDGAGTTDSQDRCEHYIDPLGEDPEGTEYDKRWLAEMAVVGLGAGNTGWKVILQESYEQAIGRTLDTLRSELLQSGLRAMVVIAVLSTALWGFVVRVLWAKAT